MNRYRSSRKLFYLFLSAHGISAIGIIYYSFISLFIHDKGYSSSIFHLIFLVSAMTLAVLLYLRLKPALSFSITLISILSMIFAVKSLMVIVGVTEYLPDNLYCIVLGLVFSVGTIFLVANLAFKGEFMIKILEKESQYKIRDSYLSWIKSMAWDNPKKVTHTKTLSHLFSLSALLLLVMFLSIAKEPPSSHLLSIYFVLFVTSSIGVFLLVRQFAFLIEWRLADREIPSDITSRWNSVIVKILVPVTALSCVIPWKYQIVNSEIINPHFKKFFDSFSVHPYTARRYPDIDVTKPNVIQPHAIYPHAIRNLLLIVGSVILFHMTLALIGLVLARIYRNKKLPRLAAFLVRQAHYWKVFLKYIAELAYYLALGLLAPVRALFSKKIIDADSKEIESQIYSFFKAYEELSDAKKDEIQSIVRNFMRLVREAGKKGIPCYPHMGPSEFTDSIRAAMPDSGKDIDVITQIFNESRYSTHILAEDQIKKFSKTIDSVIKVIPDNKQIFKD